MTIETLERRVDAGMATRAVSTVPTSWNEENRTIDVVWTTGARGARFDWTRWETIDEELSTDPGAVRLERLNGGAPVLNTHQRYELSNQIGVVVPGSARMENGQGLATLQLSSRDEVAPIIADIAAGIIRNLSVGYRVHEYEISERDGQRALYRAIDWEPSEISFVPVPFDAGAQTRSNDAAQGGHPCIIRRAQPANEENRTMSGTQTADGGAANTTATTTTTPVTGENASVAHERNEQQQSQQGQQPQQPRGDVTRFTASTALAFVDQARAFGDPVLKRAQELVEQNDRGEISIEAARSAVLGVAAEAQRAQTGTVTTGGGNVRITQDERDKFRTGAVNSLLMRAGLTDLVAQAARIRGEAVDLDPGEFRGVRNAELARISLERAGQQVRSFDRDQVVSDALTLRMGPHQSTSDFPILLETAMHKVLQAAFVVQPDTWRRVCGIGSVSDFRPHYRYLLGTFGTLDALTENGEFKNKAIPDGAKEAISAQTKGNIIGLTRQAIVNDDLGAFNTLAVQFGRAAKLSIEVDFYALLALNSGAGPNMNDGNPLFHSSHNNIAGTAAAPSVASFDAARVQMASQKDLSGNEYLDIRPAIWLGPIGLGGAARVTNGAEYDPDAVNKLQRPNIVKGQFKDIVDTPRLTGTRWYAFADPSEAPAVEVVFLNGQQEPVLEMKDGWRTDGTEWRVKLDYGIGAVNWRSGVTNAGA